MNLILGDCLEVMKDIPDKSVDMVLCDLPYGTTSCKWDIVIPLEKLWFQYKRVIKDNGVILLFGTEPFSSSVRLSNTKWYKYDWYWHKSMCSNFLNAKKQPFFKIETISVFYKKSPVYNPQMGEGKPYAAKKCSIGGQQQKYGVTKHNLSKNEGTRYPDNIIEFSNGNNKNKHPTQKPVDLLEYLIKTYTNEGAKVLDNCMGSGSTGVACVNTNRDFIGIEKEEKYFEIAKSRIEEAKQNKG